MPEACRLLAIKRHALAARIVATLRGPDIAKYRDERLRKVSPSTVRRDLASLSHVFEVARREWGIYFVNPVVDIKMPSDNKPRERRLEPGEEHRLLDACKKARNPFLLPVVRVAIETAMRGTQVRGNRRSPELTLPRHLPVPRTFAFGASGSADRAVIVTRH